MKAHYFLLYSSFALVIDGIAGTLFPGTLWIAPIVLIALMVMDRHIGDHFSVTIVCAIIIDFFSGVSFGYVTVSLLGITLVVMLIKTRMRMGIIILGTIIFLALMIIPLSARAVYNAGVSMLISSFAISIICSIIHTTSNAPMKIR